jgi:uncharacterized membrane protein YphA (DoxX/SURF4 family)
MSAAQIAALVLKVLLGVLLAYAAYTLFTWTPAYITKAREALRYPRWYWLLAGVLALIGAVGLFAGLAFPVVAAAAALWAVAYFVVAAITHLIRGDFAGFITPLFFLALSVGLLVLHWSDASPLLALVGR